MIICRCWCVCSKSNCFSMQSCRWSMTRQSRSSSQSLHYSVVGLFTRMVSYLLLQANRLVSAFSVVFCPAALYLRCVHRPRCCVPVGPDVGAGHMAALA